MDARLKLAEPQSPSREKELWQIVDSHEWFIRVTASDFSSEMEKLDGELEAKLRP